MEPWGFYTIRYYKDLGIQASMGTLGLYTWVIYYSTLLSNSEVQQIKKPKLDHKAQNSSLVISTTCFSRREMVGNKYGVYGFLSPPTPQSRHKSSWTVRTLHPQLYLEDTCIRQPYETVGYDPLIRGYNPQNGMVLDPQVSIGDSDLLRCL